jgi:hypothetical protein
MRNTGAGFLSAMGMSLSNATIKLPKSTQNTPASAIQRLDSEQLVQIYHDISMYQPIEIYIYHPLNI